VKSGKAKKISDGKKKKLRLKFRNMAPSCVIHLEGFWFLSEDFFDDYIFAW
jgi:hypothetical protein